jgi:hypothetical protein
MRKHLLHHHSQSANEPPIAMHIDTPIFREQVAHKDEPFIDHGDEGVGPFAPGVAVGDFFEDVGAFGEGVAAVADFDVHGEIGPDVEGRVDVDELEAALFFDLIPQRAVLEAGEDQLVVAPDELVGPPLHLPPARVEQPAGDLFIDLALAFYARLIDVLDGLKGKDDVADVGGLAVPDQLDFALVVEEKKAVLVGQRLVGFEEPEDVGFFLVGQTRHGRPS